MNKLIQITKCPNAVCDGVVILTKSGRSIHMTAAEAFEFGMLSKSTTRVTKIAIQSGTLMEAKKAPTSAEQSAATWN